MISNIITILTSFITHTISVLGYPGVALLMCIESAAIPLPSEIIMPFAGFLVFSHRFSLLGIALAGGVGSAIGSAITYYIGLKGGRPFILKYGKYVLLDENDLAITESFFEKYGDKTIFVSRFIPVVRHLISIPAGTGKMNIYKFIFYTVLGAGMWNAFLTYAGYYLGSNWTEIRKYSEVIDIVLVAAIIALVGFYFYKRRRHVSARSDLS